jgi:hypothetical protein
VSPPYPASPALLRRVLAEAVASPGVRQVDVARRLGVGTGTVARAVSVLRWRGDLAPARLARIVRSPDVWRRGYETRAIRVYHALEQSGGSATLAQLTRQVGCRRLAQGGLATLRRRGLVKYLRGLHPAPSLETTCPGPDT